MRKAEIKELTLENFLKYGTFANMINPKTIKIGSEPIEFYRDMASLKLGQNNLASFSVCRVTKREPVVDVTEYHTSCGEAILPLDSDVLIHVGPATPAGEIPYDRIEIFHVPKGTLVILNPGVWHHAPFAYNCDCANVLIVLPERTYANDCQVHELSSEKRIQVVERE